MKNIKEIIGEKTKSGVSSNLISPEESRQLQSGQLFSRRAENAAMLLNRVSENLVVTRDGVISQSK